jgi:short-subunit dehydrogenase
MRREGEGRTALVTGASAGIGQAFAELLAARGYHLVLVARRRERLDALAATLSRAHGIDAQVIVADLADPAAPAAIAAELTARGTAIDVLVNNAGYGVAGRYLDAPWTVHGPFLQVMVTAVGDLTHRLLPGMLARGWGRIIHVASLAGHVPAPAGHTLYAASKAFLIRFSEALHAEYSPRGVFSTAVCPGFTYSEFHDIVGTRAKVSQMPRIMWMDAPAVVAEGYAAAMRGEPVYIPGRVNRFIAWALRVLPTRLGRRLTAGAGGRYRSSD